MCDNNKDAANAMIDIVNQRLIQMVIDSDNEVDGFLDEVSKEI